MSHQAFRLRSSVTAPANVEMKKESTKRNDAALFITTLSKHKRFQLGNDYFVLRGPNSASDFFQDRISLGPSAGQKSSRSIHLLFKSRSNAIMMAGQIVKALLTAALTKTELKFNAVTAFGPARAL